MKGIHQSRLAEAESLWRRRLEQRVTPHKETCERMKGKMRELEEQIASLRRATSERAAENHELQAKMHKVGSKKKRKKKNKRERGVGVGVNRQGQIVIVPSLSLSLVGLRRRKERERKKKRSICVHAGRRREETLG